MLLVFLRVVRLVRLDAVGGDECDDEVAIVQTGEGLVEPRRPRGADLDGLVHMPPRRRLGDSESGADLGRRLVIPQVCENQQGLLEAAQPPLGRTKFTPSDR